MLNFNLLRFICLYVIFSIAPLIYNFIRSRILNKSVMNKIKGKWIIVTGATDGIGMALALEFSKRKNNILIIGRNSEKLKDVKGNIEKNGSICKTMKLDFSEHIDFQGLFDNYEIGLLVNNVGCCTEGPQYFVDDSKTEDIINVNILNTFKLTKEILKYMMKNKLGYIVNIGSITGDIPVPFLSTYSSSKAMIKSWSESLYLELKNFNINFECIDTGYVATKMSKIRKTSLFCPSTSTYAKSLIKTFGNNDVTFCYFPHLVLHFFVVLSPRSLLGLISYLRQSNIKKIIERKNKK